MSDRLPGRDRLILDALRGDGADDAFRSLPDLEGLARWIDHLNQDGTTAAELARDLDRLHAEGWLVLEGGCYRLRPTSEPPPRS